MTYPMTDTPQKSREFHFAHLAIFVTIITLLVMGRLCFNEFTWWDDNNTVHHNPLLNPPSLATVQFYWLHPAYRIYAPLTYMAWAGLALVARVSPDPDGITLDPLVFHGANVLLHVLAALVVCKILRLLKMNWVGTFFGALVFAIHPLQVEAVAWVSGLKDLLSGLLTLVALWQYLQFAIDDRDGTRRPFRLLLSIASLILAMLAKSSAATVPLAAIALDRLMIGRSRRSALTSASLLAITAVPLVVIASIAQSSGDLAPIPLWQRPLIASDSLTFYLHKLVWPINLCIDYGRTPEVAMNQSWIVIEWLVPASIAAALIIFRARVGALLAAALVFVAGCLPTLGLTTFATQFFSTTADHYLYWAMLGPSIAIAWVFTRFPGASPLRTIIVMAIVACAALLSIREGGFWKDDFSLLAHTIAINPNSFLAYNNLGNAYYRDHNAPRAADMFRRAITAKPDYAMAHSNLAAALHELGDVDGSIAELERSISLERSQPLRLRQTWIIDLNRLGQILLGNGKPAQAAAPLRESLAANPDQPDIKAMLAQAQTRSAHPAAARASSPVTP